jgi:hypothetical protein
VVEFRGEGNSVHTPQSYTRFPSTPTSCGSEYEWETHAP